MSLFRSFFRQRRPAQLLSRPALVELEPRVVPSADVLTYHNDNARTGQNLAETILTPADVNAADFGALFTDAVDGVVYAQPLYKSGVVVPGQGALDLVFVATEHDSVYAFNADSPGPAVWHDSFISPAAGVTTVSDADLHSNSIAPEVGITGTPVIDPSTNTLYVVAFTKEVAGSSMSYVQRLHALDLATGAEKIGGPVVIRASVPGTGPGSVNGVVSFDAIKENQRPALLLDNGVVYVAWASFDDITPYHGWVIGYDAQTLQQTAVFNATPDGGEGGIWQSGGGPAADAAGNIYVVTGNGTFDANGGAAPNDDYGDTFLELTPTANGLTVTSYFTPFNQAVLDARDEDLGSAGPVVLPDQSGPDAHLLIGAGKEGKIYVLNRDNLGGFDPSTDNVVQELPQAITSAFDTPAYFNGQVYFGGVGDALKAFALADGMLSSSPTSQTSTVFGYPGTTPSISADGSANGIVWVVQSGNPAVLRAYAGGDLGTELYDSTQAGGRDQLARSVKFEVPTVVNGKVYVGTQTGLTVFGLLPGKATSPYGQAGVFVTQAYQDLLGRQPDPDGLAYWSGLLNQGVLTRQQVALGIESSPEYLTDQVQQVYAQFLHRSADAAGLSYWTGMLQAGGTLAQLEAGVAGSAEYFQSRGGGTNDGFLAALYQDALGRAPDTTGQAVFEQALASGVSQSQVAVAVFYSPEFLGDVVQSRYQQFLGRSADAAGLNYWVSALENGMTDEQVIAGFVGSQEYFNRR
jgi:hypothetical protein